jgi:hypothetical protein
MEPQVPAAGIMLQKEFADAIFFTVSCDCGANDCEISLSVELDREFNYIVLNHYTTQYTLPSNTPKTYLTYNHPLYDTEYKLRAFGYDLYRKLSLTYELWSSGYVKTQHTAILTEQVALNYLTAINNAIQKLKQ